MLKCSETDCIHAAAHTREHHARHHHHANTVIAAPLSATLAAPSPNLACRFMVLVHHGGVYADLGTLCMETAAVWAPRGCHFTAAASAGAPGTLSPAVLAATAGDGTAEAVLALMLKRMKHVQALLDNGAAAANVAFNTTGAGAFTDAVIMHVGEISEEPVNDVPGLLQAKVDLRSKGVCLLTAEEMAQCAVMAEVGREW